MKKKRDCITSQLDRDEVVDAGSIVPSVYLVLVLTHLPSEVFAKGAWKCSQYYAKMLWRKLANL